MVCKYCSSGDVKKNGIRFEKQLYFCNTCERQYRVPLKIKTPKDFGDVFESLKQVEPTWGSPQFSEDQINRIKMGVSSRRYNEIQENAKRPRILIIGDTHIPAVKKGYLEFVKNIYKKYNCNKVVHIGDIVDFHAISYHEHDPDTSSISDELVRTKNMLKLWVEAFPEMLICTGNHDLLIYRKAKSHGLSRAFFKTFNAILDVPDTWHFATEHHIGDIKFFHGSGFSGKYTHANAMTQHRQNCVIGHCHSVAGIEYGASKKDLIWGMSVGCGVDDKQIVFEYGQEFPRKSVIACGVIINGKPVLEPMPLEG